MLAIWPISSGCIIDAGEINHIRLQDLLIKNSVNANVAYDETKKQAQIDELDREFIFIFIFALSTLARYRVNDWAEITWKNLSILWAC